MLLMDAAGERTARQPVVSKAKTQGSRKSNETVFPNVTVVLDCGLMHNMSPPVAP
jgi:hypothetical protein